MENKYYNPKSYRTKAFNYGEKVDPNAPKNKVGQT